MSNEYLPLAKLIEQGLRPGTVLAEFSCGNEWLYAWDGLTVLRDDGTSYDGNPLDPYRQWRIVSTPPKKITFEANVEDGYVILYVRPAFKDGDKVKITVEGVE